MDSPRARCQSTSLYPPSPPSPTEWRGKDTSKYERRKARASPQGLSFYVRLLLGLGILGLTAQLYFSSTQFASINHMEQSNNEWQEHLRRVKAGDTFVPPQKDDSRTYHTNALSRVEMKQTKARPSPETSKRHWFDTSKHNEDQKKVVEMTKWAWDAYEKYAFGSDSLDIRELRGKSEEQNDLARTLVDSLDTLFIMGMFDEFDRATDWIAHNLSERINRDGFVSVFETTIRSIGGLLSAYYLSGKEVLLNMADEIGEALSPVFYEYDHGLPAKHFDVLNRVALHPSNLAEAGSLQLEFKYLAYRTGKQRYHDQVENISNNYIRQVRRNFRTGIIPVEMDMETGTPTNSVMRMSSYGDSYYEYLLKQWLYSNKTEPQFKEQYEIAMQGMQTRLVYQSYPSNLTGIGELDHMRFSTRFEHLTCFVPGMLALGYLHGMPPEHLDLAKEVMETCYQMYRQMKSGLSPEVVHINRHRTTELEDEIHVAVEDNFNILRPETVESLMILYRVTKDEKYREYGREIRDAFERNCRMDTGGYSSVYNVTQGSVQLGYRAEMESFFIAETLKYLFLLFDDENLLPLDQIVFNTEAHPLPIASAHAYNP